MTEEVQFWNCVCLWSYNGWLKIDYTDMRRLTTGIRSEKCVIRRFRRANFIVCTYTYLDIIAFYTPRLYVIADYC